MAKSSIRKTDPADTTAQKRRRTTAAEATAKPAVKAAPRRRKAEAPVEVEASEVETVDVSHEQIAVRAYHLYLERGYPGDSFQDWVTAERQLREQGSRPRG
jgi:hypothetical protein